VKIKKQQELKAQAEIALKEQERLLEERKSKMEEQD